MLVTAMAVTGLAMGIIDTISNLQLVKLYQKDSTVFLQVRRCTIFLQKYVDTRPSHPYVLSEHLSPEFVSLRCPLERRILNCDWGIGVADGALCRPFGCLHTKLIFMDVALCTNEDRVGSHGR